MTTVKELIEYLEQFEDIVKVVFVTEEWQGRASYKEIDINNCEFESTHLYDQNKTIYLKGSSEYSACLRFTLVPSQNREITLKSTQVYVRTLFWCILQAY